MLRSTSTFAVLAIALATTSSVTARPEFVARLPNGANVPGVDALGHIDTMGGGPRNAFGLAFDAAGRRWTAELCAADSDGDGQTNGQELGDPCCTFVAGPNSAVQWTTGVSHPGDATMMSDPSLWASVSCAGGAGGAAATTPAPAPTSAGASTTTAPAASSSPAPASTSAPTTIRSPAPATTTATPAPTSGVATLSSATTLAVGGAIIAFALV